MNGLTDRRRNVGPSDLQRFIVDRSDGAKAPKEPQDGLRPVFLSQGIAAHAAGSAYLEVGEIKLHATVHGPHQLRGEFNEKADVIVHFHIGSFSGIEDTQHLERSLSDYVRSSLAPIIIRELYPKSRIVVSLTMLSGPPGAPLFAAGVNAASMALVNAGIALHDMVTAVSVSQLGSNLFTDADIDSKIEGLKQVVAAYSVETRKLVSMLVTSAGPVSRADLQALLERASSASTKLRELFNAYLVEDYAKEAEKSLAKPSETS